MLVINALALQGEALEIKKGFRKRKYYIRPKQANLKEKVND